MTLLHLRKIDQISEYNKKLSTTPNAYDSSQGSKNLICTAPQSHNFHKNHPLSLVPRNYRITTVTEHICTSHSYPQSPVTHIVAHQPNIEETYKQIIEQPHTTNFRSQNNHLLAHDEPPDWISQPFLSYPSNLQRHSSNISISDLTPSPIPSYTNNSPRMDYNDNCKHTVFHTI